MHFTFVSTVTVLVNDGSKVKTFGNLCQVLIGCNLFKTENYRPLLFCAGVYHLASEVMELLNQLSSPVTSP